MSGTGIGVLTSDISLSYPSSLALFGSSLDDLIRIVSETSFKFIRFVSSYLE